MNDGRRNRRLRHSIASDELRSLLTLHLLLLTTVASVTGIQETSDPRIVEHPDDIYVVKNEPATMNCKAEGQPPPVITWYRNGQQVVTETDNPSSHRMLLPSGQLFFLRVHSKGNRSDAGLYYCNATNPVTGTSVISRNATIAIATIRDEFRELPQNTRAATGETAVLTCRGPKGDPEPRIQWRKDDRPLPIGGDRIQLRGDGHLRLHDARKTDSGVYVCVAQNHAGERETRPVQLTVVDKPKIAEVPSEVVTHEDSDILLPCRATGDAELLTTWKKRKGVLPSHRYRILPDNTLRIKKVKVHDEGVYVCRVENSVGWQEMEMRIVVHSQPTFVATPSNKWVGVGRRVSFECEATGNPVPAIFWKRENSQSLMFPDQTYGRYSIRQDGTLVIEQAEKGDAGVFVCQAQSVAGSAVAKTRLDVKDVDSRPPPIIFYGPQNQTLPINSLASLQCSASGDPSPSIRWMKNDRLLSFNDPRFALLDSGTLQIHELRRSDTGWYTCKAVSETGETSWGGSLSVEPPTDSSIIFRRTPDPSTYPGPPSRPAIGEIRETSVRLNWKPNSNHGASSVSAFTVEYFSHETGEGWTVASDRIQDAHYVVKDLRPDTVYRFLVRAQNSQGLSLPSPVTSPVKTKGVNASLPTASSSSSPVSSVFHPDHHNSIISLSKGGGGGGGAPGSVLLRPPDAIGSKSMQLRWEVRRNPRLIDGFHVHYCVVSRPDTGDDDEENEEEEEEAGAVPPPPPPPPRRETCDLQSAPPAIQTVQNGDARTHVLDHLEENTWYKISLKPYQQLTEGAESNYVYAKTLEDAPSAAPTNIHAVMNENNTLRLTWNPPPKQHLNGLLTGYKIFLSSNESSLWRDIWTNVSSDEVYVHRLSKDVVYSIQIAAYNEKGEGVRSSPLLVEYHGRRREERVVPVEQRRSPWLMVVVIVCVGGVLWLGVCSLSVWLYRCRHSGRRQTKYSARQTKPCLSSVGGEETEQDDSRGMLMENTYENVLSVKAVRTMTTAMSTAKSSSSSTAAARLEEEDEEEQEEEEEDGAGASVSVAVSSVNFLAPPPPSHPLPPRSNDDNSPAYQQGLPINYPSSSGFSSTGQMDPFYENYIIKPKPVYACNNQNSSVDYTESQDKQLFAPMSCAVAPIIDYDDAFRSNTQLPDYNFDAKTYLRNDPLRENRNSRRNSQKQHHHHPSIMNTSDIYTDFNRRPPYHGDDGDDDDDYNCHYPPYQPYHYHPVPYPSHTIQSLRTAAESRLADSSPHATSEPEPMSAYVDDQSLRREATVVRYFSETDGLLNNGRQHQYPPSPAPMEPLRAGNSPEIIQHQQQAIKKRPEVGYERNQSVLLNNERNLFQTRLTMCSK